MEGLGSRSLPPEARSCGSGEPEVRGLVLFRSRFQGKEDQLEAGMAGLVPPRIRKGEGMKDCPQCGKPVDGFSCRSCNWKDPQQAEIDKKMRYLCAYEE